MAGLRLGNLSIQDVEDKHGFYMSDEDKSFLESKRQDNAQRITDGMFHIFDLPNTSFHFLNRESAIEALEILKKYQKSIQGQIQFTIEGEG